MTVLSKVSRKSLIVGSACFVIGFGIGIFFEQWMLWNRQVGRFNELIRRLAIIEDEIRMLRVRLKGTKTDNVNVSGSKPILGSDESEDDEFLDPESEFEDYMSAASELPGTISSQDMFFAEIDRLLDGSLDDKQNAYQTLRDKRIKLCDKVDFLWRWARAAYCMYEREGGSKSEAAKQYMYEAFTLIEKAVKLDDNSSSAHKWYAIIIGVIGELEGTQAKIKNGYEFKKHIDRALHLNPEDHEAHYLKGRFCYGVYMLSWIERQMASALFATPPTATIEDALEAFTQCETLEPNQLKRNQLYIARCHIELRDYEEAVSWLESASKIVTDDEFDNAYQQEILDLLAQYQTS